MEVVEAGTTTLWSEQLAPIRDKLSSREKLCKGETEAMSYDDVEIEDMEWDVDLAAYTYPCPCGDLFQITRVRNPDLSWRLNQLLQMHSEPEPPNDIQ